MQCGFQWKVGLYIATWQHLQFYNPTVFNLGQNAYHGVVWGKTPTSDRFCPVWLSVLLNKSSSISRGSGRPQISQPSDTWMVSWLGLLVKYIFNKLSWVIYQIQQTCLGLFHWDETKLHPLDQFILNILLDFAAEVATKEAQPVNGPSHTEDQATVGPSHTQATGRSHTQATAGPSHT